MTLAEKLVTARQRADLSLEELSARTRIRPGLLSEMEAGEFARCGGNFYARGHLRAIARVVGSDPDPWVELFNTEHAAPEVDPSRRQERADAKPPTVHAARPRWAVVVGAVLVGLMGWGMVRVFTLPNDIEATAVPSTPTPVVTTPVAKPPPVKKTPTKAPPPRAPAGPTQVRVTVIASAGATYLTMRNIRGEELFSGMLGKGVSQSLAYPGMMRVGTGVPRNVKIWVNGKRVYPKVAKFTVTLAGQVIKKDLRPR